jgi:hypothetical protein
MPKTIGMIGGLSPESTITYYEHITRGFYERTGHCPDIVIRSVDLTDYTEWFSAGHWERAGAAMAAIFEQMRSVGVDFGLICANTPPRAAVYLQRDEPPDPLDHRRDGGFRHPRGHEDRGPPGDQVYDEGGVLYARACRPGHHGDRS